MTFAFNATQLVVWLSGMTYVTLKLQTKTAVKRVSSFDGGFDIITFFALSKKV